MKFVKENKKLVFEILCIIILIPIVFLWDCPLIDGVFPKDIGIALAEYSGSIVGGFLTLYGVWWTIKDQAEKRREDLAIQYKPTISFLATDDYEKQSCHYYITKNKELNPEAISIDEFYKSEYVIQLLNEGRGNAYVHYEITCDHENVFIKSKMDNNSERYLLRMNRPFNITLNLEKNLYISANDDITIYFFIEYCDEFEIFEYTLEVELHLRVVFNSLTFLYYTFRDKKKQHYKTSVI
ncbi:hypothetical protein [Holdemania filiformis]|uniref:hypothetical protein n=2 Tax=Holdemania TaxID=61170 RepID=UPI00210A63F9|nr:hypothetical protein [Holdemania filiformis]MCQ4953026.1 hypothetical protein [Holdemania filiformis]